MRFPKLITKKSIAWAILYIVVPGTIYAGIAYLVIKELVEDAKQKISDKKRKNPKVDKPTT